MLGADSRSCSSAPPTYSCGVLPSSQFHAAPAAIVSPPPKGLKGPQLKGQQRVASLYTFPAPQPCTYASKHRLLLNPKPQGSEQRGCMLATVGEGQSPIV